MFADSFKITTERLLLRLVKESDYISIYNLFSNEKIMKPYGMFPLTSEEDAQIFTKRLLVEEEIVILYQNKIIGSIGFVDVNEPNRRLEVAFTLLPEYWSQGFMTEALRAVCEYCFSQLHFLRMESFVFVDNIGSQKVFKKVGFVLEGHLHKRSMARGVFHDHLLFAILNPNRQLE